MILKCSSCGHYTLKEKCRLCGSGAKDPKPVRFSPEDRYAKYRRLAKGKAIYKASA